MLYGSEFNSLMVWIPPELQNKTKVFCIIRLPTSFSNVKYLKETLVYLHLAS